MLQALQKEIEKLKQRNIDLQRRLVLETRGKLDTELVTESEKNKLDELATVQELKKKIAELQEHLKLALESNKLLKKELEAKRLHSGSTRHNMAESHAPIIQQAEQVKASLQGARNVTHCISELNVNTGVRGVVRAEYEDKKLLNVNHSNALSSTVRKIQEPINRYTNSSTPVLPVSGPAAISPLPPIGTKPQCLALAEYTSSQPISARPSPGLHPPHPPPPLHSFASVPHPEAKGTATTRLQPLRQPPPMPNLQESLHSPSPVTSPQLLPSLPRQGIPNTAPIGCSALAPRDSVNSLSLDAVAAPRRRDDLLLRSANGRIELQKQPCFSGDGGYESGSLVTLPALRQTLDVNQAARRRRTLEMQKKRLAHARNPYLS
ncbi:hypothetical protein AAHC03_04737 [Spirometra sp. Aus1]